MSVDESTVWAEPTAFTEERFLEGIRRIQIASNPATFTALLSPQQQVDIEHAIMEAFIADAIANGCRRLVVRATKWTGAVVGSETKTYSITRIGGEYQLWHGRRKASVATELDTILAEVPDGLFASAVETCA